MATPETPKQAPEKRPKEKKAKTPKVKKHGRTPGEKTAREWAVEYLKAHGGKAKFGELTKYVIQKLGGNLSWTPTYYLNSPGFSRPERGVVQFSEKAYEKGQAEIAERRRERLSGARAKAGKKAKPGKTPKKSAKTPKKESVQERRERTSKELKEKREKQENGAKEEFDAAVRAQAPKEA